MSDTNNRPELVINWDQERPQENNSDDNKDDFDEMSFGLRYLDNLILIDRKRKLIDHYRIYLSTLDEFKLIFLRIELEKLPAEFWNNNKKILTVAFLKICQEIK